MSSHNIFYFTPYFKEHSNAAGVRNEHFINELSKEFHLYVFTPNTNKKTAASFSQNSQIKYGRVQLPQNTDPFLIRLLKEFLVGIDIIFASLFHKSHLYILSSPPFISVLTASLFFSIFRKPFVLDIRDIYPEVFFHSKLLNEKSFLGNLILGLTRFIYKNALLVVATTEGQLKSIKSIYANVNGKVVTNGFDHNHFSPIYDKRQEFTVVFHGTMGRFQENKLLFEVFNETILRDKSIHFLIIGKGIGDVYFKNINSKNLTYMPEVHYAILPSLIGKCHLGLSFRTDDLISNTAMPVKFYEYLGLEIPTIITPQNNSLPTYMDSDCFISFQNDQRDLIVSKIIELKNNQQFYQDIKKKIASVSFHFRRDHLALKFKKFILELLDKSQS